MVVYLVGALVVTEEVERCQLSKKLLCLCVPVPWLSDRVWSVLYKKQLDQQYRFLMSVSNFDYPWES